MPRRLAAVIAVVAVLVIALGAWLVFFQVTEKDRVEAALGDLMAAVEAKDPTGLGRRLDDAYSGWGGDKASALSTFEAILPNFDSPNLSTRELVVEIGADGKTATATFEWNYTARLTSDVGTVDTSKLPSSMQPWEPATARFAKGTDGAWRLVGVETKIPLPRR